MRKPDFAQGLEATPAVVRPQGHGKDIAHFAIEIRQVALRMVDRADGDVRQASQTIVQEAQGDAFAGARIAVDHREAAFADLGVLDSPAEVLDPGRHKERLDRQFGGEGIPLQPVEGEEPRVHAGSWSSEGKYAGGRPVAA
jgi:hypothetical protein